MRVVSVKIPSNPRISKHEKIIVSLTLWVKNIPKPYRDWYQHPKRMPQTEFSTPVCHAAKRMPWLSMEPSGAAALRQQWKWPVEATNQDTMTLNTSQQSSHSACAWRTAKTRDFFTNWPWCVDRLAAWSVGQGPWNDSFHLGLSPSDLPPGHGASQVKPLLRSCPKDCSSFGQRPPDPGIP